MSGSDESIEQAWTEVLGMMTDTFVKKNNDYGHNNLAVGGVPGVVLRMSDKVSRLWQLSGLNGSVKQQVSDERMQDTFLDLANYAVVGYLMAAGKWPKATIDDVMGMPAVVAALKRFMEEPVEVEDRDYAEDWVVG
jgi:hypothetical protein